MTPRIIAVPVAFWLCLAAAVSAQDSHPRNKESVTHDLDQIARVATVMVDGDLCRRIITQRALDSIFTVDPRDPWAASDNFDVNHEPYIQTKKTLIRLSRLVSYPCDVNLWMPFRERSDRIQILIRNVNEWSQFWTWGVLVQDMVPEMKRVLDTGERITVSRRPGMISVLSPVYDSLGDRVALVEVASLDPGATPPPVHARVRARSADQRGSR